MANKPNLTIDQLPSMSKDDLNATLDQVAVFSESANTSKKMSAADFLSSIPAIDPTDPANITQDSTHRFVTDTQVSTWNAAVPNTRTVNGHPLSADVTVTKSDVGLSNVDNTTDLNKAISTATQSALDAKEPLLPSKVGNALKFLQVNGTATGWQLAPVSGTGDLVGPGSAVDSNFLAFNTTTGKLAKDSGYNGGSFAPIAHVSNLSNPHSTTKTQVGLGNVPNLDTSNPANITQDTTHRFITDTERTNWNGKQDALGFTAVPNTRTVAGHALSADVVVTKSDVGLGAVTNDAQIAKSLGIAKGDMIVFNAAGTPQRLAVGPDGTAVVADSTQVAGVKYSATIAGTAAWNVITGKPSYTVGDAALGPTIQTALDAIAALGNPDCTLTIQPKPGGGMWDAPSSPFPTNIDVKFTGGAVIDYTAVPHGDVSSIAANGTKVRVTTATAHGLSAGNWVKLVGIKADPNWQWRAIRYMVKIDSVGTNYFDLAIDPTGWPAFVETGITYTGVRFFRGVIDAPYTKIFHCASPCIVFGTTQTDGGLFLKQTYQQNLRPEWWGAKGDWSFQQGGTGTDDFQALYYCFYAGDFANVWGSWKAMSIELSRNYRCTDTLSLLECNTYGSLIVWGHGWGTGIVSEAPGYPALEVMSTNQVICRDFGIRGQFVNGVGPSVGLLNGRSSFGENAGLNEFKLRFTGNFKYGAHFNHTGEVNWYDFIIDAVPYDSSWGFYVGWGSHAEYPNIIPRNVGWGNTLSSFQNYYNRLLINGYSDLPINSSIIYSNNTQSGGIGIVKIEECYLSFFGALTNVDVFRMKGGCNLNLGDIVTEGDQIGGWFFNLSSTFPVGCTINMKNVLQGQNWSRLIQADTNSRIENSEILGMGDIDVGAVWASKIHQNHGVGGYIFKVNNGASASDFHIAYDSTATLVDIGSDCAVYRNGLAIGGDTNSKAILTLNSTTKGFLPPVMTTTQKNAITTPPAGLVVYDSNLNKLCVYTGAAWQTITSV